MSLIYTDCKGRGNMKRKYYMRGLGIGVIVSAILFSFAFPKSAPNMTDEEVIARAKELGYTKKTEGVTADDIDKIKDNVTPQPGSETEGEADHATEGTPGITPDATPGPTPSPVPTPEPPDRPDQPKEPDRPSSTPEPTKAPTNTPKPTKAPTSTPEPTKAPTNTPKPTKAPTNTPVPTKTPSGTVYTIKVERGMTASRVSRLLEEVGAVSSATEFVTYLRNNSLTDDINIGTFQIPAGADFKEIADILTKIR